MYYLEEADTIFINSLDAFYTSLHSLCYIGYLLWVYSYMNG